MISAVELTVSKIGGGQRSEGSGHSEIDYNLLKCNFTELECTLNGLPRRRFALSQRSSVRMGRQDNSDVDHVTIGWNELRAVNCLQTLC